MKANRPPSDGFQFFGTLKASAKTRALTAQLHDLAGKILYTVELPVFGHDGLQPPVVLRREQRQTGSGRGERQERAGDIA